MEEIVGDIWDAAEELDAKVVIPTNGFTRNDGCAVMGRGLAKQAAERYPHLPSSLGSLLDEFGNNLYWFPRINILTFPVKEYWFPRINILTFPVKEYWWHRADIELVERSASQLRAYALKSKKHTILLPRVGCGNGRLLWEDVKPILVEYLGSIEHVKLCDRRSST